MPFLIIGIVLSPTYHVYLHVIAKFLIIPCLTIVHNLGGDERYLVGSRTLVNYGTACQHLTLYRNQSVYVCILRYFIPWEYFLGCDYDYYGAINSNTPTTTIQKLLNLTPPTLYIFTICMQHNIFLYIPPPLYSAYDFWHIFWIFCTPPIMFYSGFSINKPFIIQQTLQCKVGGLVTVSHNKVQYSLVLMVTQALFSWSICGEPIISISWDVTGIADPGTWKPEISPSTYLSIVQKA